jgi:hypothetical protein
MRFMGGRFVMHGGTARLHACGASPDRVWRNVRGPSRRRRRRPEESTWRRLSIRATYAKRPSTWMHAIGGIRYGRMNRSCARRTGRRLSRLSISPAVQLCRCFACGVFNLAASAVTHGASDSAAAGGGAACTKTRKECLCFSSLILTKTVVQCPTG